MCEFHVIIVTVLIVGLVIYTCPDQKLKVNTKECLVVIIVVGLLVALVTVPM